MSLVPSADRREERFLTGRIDGQRLVLHAAYGLARVGEDEAVVAPAVYQRDLLADTAAEISQRIVLAERGVRLQHLRPVVFECLQVDIEEDAGPLLMHFPDFIDKRLAEHGRNRVHHDEVDAVGYRREMLRAMGRSGAVFGNGHRNEHRLVRTGLVLPERLHVPGIQFGIRLLE